MLLNSSDDVCLFSLFGGGGVFSNNSSCEAGDLLFHSLPLALSLGPIPSNLTSYTEKIVIKPITPSSALLETANIVISGRTTCWKMLQDIQLKENEILELQLVLMRLNI